MNIQQTHGDDVDNVGLVDRINRIIAATALIIVAVLFTAIPAPAVVGLVAVGIYAGLSGIIGWDPVYALVKTFHHQAPLQTPPMTTFHRDHGEQPSTDDYKKAA